MARLFYYLVFDLKLEFRVARICVIFTRNYKSVKKRNDNTHN
jgi:hypothetical protein